MVCPETLWILTVIRSRNKGLTSRHFYEQDPQLILILAFTLRK